MNKAQSHRPATIFIKAIENKYLRAQSLQWIFWFKSFQGSHRDKDNPHVPTHKAHLEETQVQNGTASTLL